MTTVRCYVPVTGDQLAALAQDRRLTGPVRATAVTEVLRALEPGADGDELEYAAAQVAAEDLVRSGAPVVLAAVDADAGLVTAAPADDLWIEVASVDLPRVAALHLGDDVVTGDPSLLGDHDAEDIELSWFDTTELGHVLELVRRAEHAGRDAAPAERPTDRPTD
ncbi:hypothetical protein AVL62_02480 [Serinicoccus chungangensis]|uniref:Uncharacterized protein n=1 Tax=Serinicoccus chungangensis TaxID=767452 RepID=A0A0W8I5Z5_9MICO|nr:hypothetical protein [Serinicoccus chungangensis]KUG53663.1 hypothetical protein AVL62_02480 [Serinicoccus chungangensis]